MALEVLKVSTVLLITFFVASATYLQPWSSQEIESHDKTNNVVIGHDTLRSSRRQSAFFKDDLVTLFCSM
jgi:hypothetical protein